MTPKIVRRIANRYRAALEEETLQAPSKRLQIQQTASFSASIRNELRKAFTAKGLQFFDFYSELEFASRSAPTPDLVTKFRSVLIAIGQVIRSVL